MWTALGCAVGLFVPAAVGLCEYLVERKGSHITLTPREWIANPEWPREGQQYLVGSALIDFQPRMQQYTKTAEIVITLASAAIVLIPSHLSKVPGLAFSFVLLGATIVWGVAFVAWMSYCYEQALYSPDHFGARESSIMFGLGFGALACFAFAFLSLSIGVAHAIANGASLG